MRLKVFLLFTILSGSLLQAQTENSSLTYHVELGATAGNGTYASLWFTGNRYGLESHTKSNFNTDGALKLD